ncbi:MAG: MFS transporter, partial [Pseudomonadota bacterium]
RIGASMSAVLAVRIFLPFALGYMVCSVFRSINAVTGPEIALDLGLSAGELGLAVSLLFVGSVLAQIPVGILLDRYDPRWVYGGTLMVCVAGAVVFAAGNTVAQLGLGRAMIAVGVASSITASFKVNATWFPAKNLPLVNGLTMAVGGLGLMAGTLPVAWALETHSWRQIHVGVAALVAVCLVLVVVAAPARPAGSGQTGNPMYGFATILGSLAFWRAAPIMMALMGSFGTMAQLWAGPWLRDVADLSVSASANRLMLVAAAMSLSGLSTGPINAGARRLGISPLGVGAGSAVIALAMLILVWLQWVPNTTTITVIWIVFGFFAPLSFIIYAALAPQFPKSLTGRLNACMTLSWMLAAFVLQSAYGFVLDLYPATESGYAPKGHKAATLLLIVPTVGALIWYAISARFASPRRDKA